MTETGTIDNPTTSTVPVEHYISKPETCRALSWTST
jgi:hypothetical protein